MFTQVGRDTAEGQDVVGDLYKLCRSDPCRRLKDRYIDRWIDGWMYTYAEGPEMLRGARLLPPPLLEHRPHGSAARQGSNERTPQRLSAQRGCGLRAIAEQLRLTSVLLIKF